MTPCTIRNSSKNLQSRRNTLTEEYATDGRSVVLVVVSPLRQFLAVIYSTTFYIPPSRSLSRSVAAFILHSPAPFSRMDGSLYVTG